VVVQSPQDYLDEMMTSRGYSTKKYKTLQTAYHNKPTELQNASYDVHLIGIVKRSNSADLEEIMRSGISPNPCNSYGESLVHMVCRRGDQKLLQIMIQNGCDIQVADDYGRTPLHDACWAASPAFETVQLLLDKDPTLLQMTDCRGSLPLSYVRKEHWEEWSEFLESKKDTYWPNLTTVVNGTDATSEALSAFVAMNPNSRPLPDPANALPLDLANKVASGVCTPQEAIFFRNQRAIVDKSLQLDDLEDDDDSGLSYESEEDDDDSEDDDSCSDDDSWLSGVDDMISSFALQLATPSVVAE
jgi:Ankyrin repeats (3 copies)